MRTDMPRSQHRLQGARECGARQSSACLVWQLPQHGGRSHPGRTREVKQELPRILMACSFLTSWVPTIERSPEHGSWGKDAVVQCVSAPGRVCEVLDTEPACEQAHSTFLTHAAGSHPCERWRLVCPQISPYQLCHLFPIL